MVFHNIHLGSGRNKK